MVGKKVIRSFIRIFEKKKKKNTSCFILAIVPQIFTLAHCHRLDMEVTPESYRGSVMPMKKVSS